MPTLLLVHGAFADHHAFDAVVAPLTAAGFRVEAPDLLGHGDDHTDPQAVTLDAYVDQIAARVAAIGAPVTLVGHSMAGMVVSAVAERLPDAIERVVYVAAYVPTSGQSLQQLAESDPTSLVGPLMRFAPDWTTVSLDPSGVVAALCADAPPAIQELVRVHQRPEPLAPFQGTVSLTSERFGRVPKAYLQTTADRAVTPDLQRRMLAVHPAVRVGSIDTGHLPFLSQPEAFVARLRGLLGP